MVLTNKTESEASVSDRHFRISQEQLSLVNLPSQYISVWTDSHALLECPGEVKCAHGSSFRKGIEENIGVQ